MGGGKNVDGEEKKEPGVAAADALAHPFSGHNRCIVRKPTRDAKTLAWGWGTHIPIFSAALQGICHNPGGFMCSRDGLVLGTGAVLIRV